MHLAHFRSRRGPGSARTEARREIPIAYPTFLTIRLPHVGRGNGASIRSRNNDAPGEKRARIIELARDNEWSAHSHRNIKIICHYFNKSVPPFSSARFLGCLPSPALPLLAVPHRLLRSPHRPPRPAFSGFSRAREHSRQAVADVTVPLMSALFFTSIFIPFIGCPLHKLSAGY